MAFPHDWHRGVLQDFLDSIEQDREPRVSGAETLKVHRFINAVLRGDSLANQGTVKSDG